MSTLTVRCYVNPDSIFDPRMNVISAITQAELASVTTTIDHGYVDGTIVRLDIQPSCGMIQMDGLTSPILVTGATTFTTNIDSRTFDAFAIPAAPQVRTNICSLVVPLAENNGTLDASVRNIL